MLLNVTVVLPRFHTFFNEAGEQRRLGDPNAAVHMDYYYEVETFISTLAPMVSIVRVSRVRARVMVSIVWRLPLALSRSRSRSQSLTLSLSLTPNPNSKP